MKLKKALFPLTISEVLSYCIVVVVIEEWSQTMNYKCTRRGVTTGVNKTHYILQFYMCFQDDREYSKFFKIRN